jgi:O-acetyl-ADP-ribose deacetylase (regulator of RNase III)
MIEIVRADITTLAVDAIVNAANPALAGGGGVDGAIHAAAGPELARAAVRHAPLATGDAVLTPGFALPARFVIHTVGPIWRGGDRGEADLLRSAYERSFEVALAEGSIRTIAFPAISSGIYGYPKEEAARIAVAAMRRWESRFERIVAAVLGSANVALYERVMGEADGGPPRA